MHPFVATSDIATKTGRKYYKTYPSASECPKQAGHLERRYSLGRDRGVSCWGCSPCELEFCVGWVSEPSKLGMGGSSIADVWFSSCSPPGCWPGTFASFWSPVGTLSLTATGLLRSSWSALGDSPYSLMNEEILLSALSRNTPNHCRADANLLRRES